VIPVRRSFTCESGRVAVWIEPPPFIFDLCVLESQLRTPDDYTKCCAVLLEWSIDDVEEFLTSKELFYIVGSALKASRVASKQIGETTDTAHVEAQQTRDETESLWDLVYTISFYTGTSVEHLLRLPTPLVIGLSKRVQKLVDQERKFQLDISAVRALAAAFGGDTSTESSSDQVIDLSDENALERLATMSDLPIEVEA